MRLPHIVWITVSHYYGNICTFKKKNSKLLSKNFSKKAKLKHQCFWITIIDNFSNHCEECSKKWIHLNEHKMSLKIVFPSQKVKVCWHGYFLNSVHWNNHSCKTNINTARKFIHSLCKKFLVAQMYKYSKITTILKEVCEGNQQTQMSWRRRKTTYNAEEECDYEALEWRRRAETALAAWKH